LRRAAGPPCEAAVSCLYLTRVFAKRTHAAPAPNEPKECRRDALRYGPASRG
jgi:hypothetical protein